ncbi:GNAT family N-acetyltransferase [Legionella israelensis]|uniref:GNAT family N-acetyltransferase n=1 Tax=Legionella israelensis TaxID=454 RepID=A0AAX1EI95_9GAMM|nr:GNAT family N-acetyltransferase [Legionella israelensis]QBR84860.1 GNAT family N-acetyltransferase [Legionella israelensis]
MIKIDFLKNHPHIIPSLAQIWHKVLGSIWMPDKSIEDVEQCFYSHLNDGQMPLTFVAFHHNKPVGMCSLRENDGIRSDLTPWLASLVVDSDYQKRGIGKLLMDSTKQKAKQLGFAELFLFAFAPKVCAYYEKLEWEKIAMDQFAEHPVTVMKTLLTDKNEA